MPAVLSGLALAFSIPPWGLWPLAYLGLAILYWRLKGLGLRTRLWCGWVTGVAMMALSLFWATNFTYPGWLVLVALEAAFIALAAAVVPAHRGRAWAYPGVWVLAVAARDTWPFGGVPLGGLDLGQVGGPLAPSARLGGHLLLVGLSAGIAVAMVELGGLCRPWLPKPLGLGPRARREHRLVPFALAGLGLVLALALAGFGTVAPDGGRPIGHIRVAVVQGGGPRGFRQIDVNPNRVFQAQLAAGANLKPPLDLVLWPENVISLDRPLVGSPQAATVSRLAQSLNAVVIAGITEPVGQTRFRNAAVAWSRDGKIIARYDKVHRVPFGEYVPWRSLFSHLANLSAVPRDAIAGHGSGLMATPVGNFGVTISFEVFYAGRARSAINAGGTVLLVPTNAASYPRSQVPTQEVAAARLRAIEEGRDLAQAGPTGYSAIIDNHGRVHQRSVLGRAQVLEAVMAQRSGRTVYARFGDLPVLALSLLIVCLAWGSMAWARRRIPSRIRPEAAPSGPSV
ncbi:MAG: apolipoprotein N-acyltransferase [Acidimicrobiales bacterium]